MKRPRSGMIGAVLGFLFFLAFLALPTLAFAVNMGHMLAAVVLGSPVQRGLLYSLFVGFNVVVGIMAIGFFFASMGSVIGLFIGAIFNHVRFGKKSPDEPLFVIEREGPSS